MDSPSGSGIAHPYGLTKNKQPRRPPSVVWHYFEKIALEPQRAKCRLCGASCHHANNTSNLFKHLQKKHPQHYKEAESQRESQMEVYQECKAKYGSPVVRTGIRGRRPKALTAAMVAQGLLPPPRHFRDGKPDIKPNIGQDAPSSTHTRRPNFFSSKTINRALMKVLTVDLQPASIVEGKGFREFVKTLDAKYEPPTKKSIMKSMMVDLAEETKNKIKLDVVRASYLAISVESWSHRQCQSFLTVSGHYIKDTWDKSSVVLDTVDCTDDTTGEALAGSLKRITNEWGISECIISLVSNGSNPMVTMAAAHAGWEHVLCFGSTLNTVVLNAMTCVSEIVRVQKKTNEAVSYFQMATKAADTLAAVQQQHNLPVHKLKLENVKYWNSTYKMFTRMVEQFEAVNTVLCFLSKDHMCLCDDEVELMRSVIDILKPFEAATEELCTTDYTYLSKVIPLSSLLTQVTAAHADPLVPGPQSAFKAALLQQMQQHFSNFESTYELAVSTLLDPRFKKHAFNNHSALETAQARLQNEISLIVQSTDNSSGADNSVNDSSSSFWNMFDKKVSEAGALKDTSSEADNESRRYFQEANIPRKSDPLQWWRLNEVQFPHMKSLAQKYLSIPATSMPSYRLFSKKGSTVERSRDAIKPAYLGNVLFLNKNLTTKYW